MLGLDSALQGLAQSQANFDRAAARIARMPSSAESQNPQDQVSLSDEMVTLLEARNNYEANLRTLKTGDKMQKTLLNLLG